MGAASFGLIPSILTPLMITDSRSLRPILSLCRMALMLVGTLAGCTASAGPVLKVLFIGDSSAHRPAERLRWIAPDMMSRGIQIVYTEDLDVLTLEHLQRYDAVILASSIEAAKPGVEQAIVDYVAQGGGLVGIHTASDAFRNSARFGALLGAQFKQAGPIATFRTRSAQAGGLLQDWTAFESTDEIIVHVRHNDKDRTLLELRETEPWTWTRTEGKGRVFYTAWGHDHQTWGNAGFRDLLERGIRFAAGEKMPEALAARPKVAPLPYVEQKGIPYYVPGQRTQGEAAWPRMQQPLSPPDSMQHLVVPAGFEVQLVAGDPDIKKPIAMQWDERGRLWIAESLDYPNRVLPPGESGRDRLVVCDDTNGDGRMDTFTVFADGLNIPTGFTFADGGVIVHQMPNTLFLKDTDGDGRADLKEVLIHGWGRRDTHAGPNNLVYGHDNWIWGMVGYSGFEGTVGGKARAYRQGFYRFRPDGSELEFMRATNNNTWGIGLSEDGLVFGSTANNNPSVYLPIPDRYYGPAGLEAKTLGGIADTSRFVALTDRVRQVDVHWGYTAAAGHALYTARSFPKEYWNRIAFVAEPTGHLVGQFNLERLGANVLSKNPTNLIVSDDEWFAPIMAEVGPDGAVWVIDWYNYIVQHNPTPKGFQTGDGNAYENKLRDQRFGRIYKIVWRAGKPTVAPKLAGASPEQLVFALTNENLLWRRHAQRLLVERRRKDVVPALISLVRNQRQDEIGLNVGAIHALWTLAGLNAIDTDPAALVATLDALHHPSPGVRRTAVTVLPRSVANGAALLKAHLLEDADGQVRLAALLAFAESPEVPDAGPALRTALGKPGVVGDVWLLDAAKMAATAQEATFLRGVSATELATAKSAVADAQKNLLKNGSFETGTGATSAGWELGSVRGSVEVDRVNASHAGLQAVRLTAKEPASADLITRHRVKPATRYELTGWVRPERIQPIDVARGALLSVVQSQGAGERFNSNAVRGNREWTPLKVGFETGISDEVSVACVIGGGGMATGTALFDDLSLIELGPSDGTIRDPLNNVLAHLATRDARGSSATAAAMGPTPIMLSLGVVPDVMKYDRPELTVKAGAAAKLVFKNSDHMQHNVLILRPGSIDAVGALADQMLTDPTATARNFVPLSGDVLFHTPLVNPGETFELTFTAPPQPGRYPFVCTFPGHWRIMQGIMVVTTP